MGYSELFSGGSSGAFPMGGAAASFPLILAGFLDPDRLKSSILSAIERIKFESEQELFSKRNSAVSSSSIEDVESAARMLEFTTEAIQFQAEGIMQSQANVNPNTAMSLLAQ